jgi:hypothetical protein
VASLGTYGLRLTGLEGATSLLQEAPSGWPRLDVVRREGVARHEHDSLSEDSAVLVLQQSGEILLDRRNARAEFVVPRELGDAELVHPYLAPVAVVFGGWLGRESLHAGAFAAEGGVWAVVGDRESGKSSMLAALALAGSDIVCDDILVLEGDEAFAGPRSLDLRGDAAERLGVGTALGVVGARERWRVELEAIPNELAFRGFVFLEWGDGPALESLGARERLERVAAARALRVAADPKWLLRLAGRPARVLRRPRGWASLDPSLALLRELG